MMFLYLSPRQVGNVVIVLLVVSVYIYFASIARRLDHRESAAKQILTPALIILTFGVFVIVPDALLLAERSSEALEEEIVGEFASVMHSCTRFCVHLVFLCCACWHV